MRIFSLVFSCMFFCALVCFMGLVACSGSDGTSVAGGSGQVVGANVQDGVYVSRRLGYDDSFHQLTVSINGGKVSGNIIHSQLNKKYIGTGVYKRVADVTESLVLPGFTIKATGDGRLTASGVKTASGKFTETDLVLTKTEKDNFVAASTGAYARYKVTIEGKVLADELKVALLPPGTLVSGHYPVIWDARVFSREPQKLACVNDVDHEFQQGAMGDIMGVSREGDSKKWPALWRNCDKANKETIKVPAGVFETCKYTNPSYPGVTIWLGNVPTGIVKMSGDTSKDYFYSSNHYIMGPEIVDIRCDFYRNGTMELAAFSH